MPEEKIVLRVAIGPAGIPALQMDVVKDPRLMYTIAYEIERILKGETSYDPVCDQEHLVVTLTDVNEFSLQVPEQATMSTLYVMAQRLKAIADMMTAMEWRANILAGVEAAGDKIQVPSVGRIVL